jgi:5-methylcytosine-specific restriction endonuclease McrA
MRYCIACKAEINHKTSNNVKRCERCQRLKNANRRNITKRSFSIAQVKNRLITLYSGGCAICNWRATDKLLTIEGKTFYSYGCELHHIETVSKGGEANINNLILLCPNHHKQADLQIISKEELKAYQIPGEGVVDNWTLKRKGAELIDTIL